MVISQDTDTLTLIFNERHIEAKPGVTILEVARENGIYQACVHILQYRLPVNAVSASLRSKVSPNRYLHVPGLCTMIW
jgi:hypothetical protein